MVLHFGSSVNVWFQKKIHTHPIEGHWKFLGGGGVLKAKFLEEMFENKLKFHWGGGGQNKKPSVGGVWIFSGTAQLTFCGTPVFKTTCKAHTKKACTQKHHS